MNLWRFLRPSMADLVADIEAAYLVYWPKCKVRVESGLFDEGDSTLQACVKTDPGSEWEPIATASTRAGLRHAAIKRIPMALRGVPWPLEVYEK